MTFAHVHQFISGHFGAVLNGKKRIVHKADHIFDVADGACSFRLIGDQLADVELEVKTQACKNGRRQIAVTDVGGCHGKGNEGVLHRRQAVIGIGHLGKIHAGLYREVEQADLVGIYDLDVDKAERVSKDLGVPFYNELSQLLSKAEAVTTDDIKEFFSKDNLKELFSNQRFVIWGLIFAAFYNIDSGITDFFFEPWMVSKFGATVFQVGAFTAVTSIFAIVGAIIGWLLGDKIKQVGQKKVLTVALICFAAGYALTSLVK